MATATFCRMIPVRRKCILKNKQVSWLKLRPQRLPKKSVASCCILAITVTGSSRNHTGFPFHRANARTYFQRPKGRLCELFIIIAQHIRHVNKIMIKFNTFLFKNAKTQKADPNDMKNPDFFISLGLLSGFWHFQIKMYLILSLFCWQDEYVMQ